MTRDTWMIFVRWPGEGWKPWKRHRVKQEAIEETVSLRSRCQRAKWRVEKRRYK